MASELPSGSVTFLLTDIEGSTRLFRRLGDRYPPLLDQHLTVLRDAWAAHEGYQFKVDGDGVLVAFGSAASAMAAAVDAQTRLRYEKWPVDGNIRVRMGLHAGIAYPRDGDYIALALHQAARVVGAANGGQVITSGAALSAAGPLARLTTARLGSYRLRDFDGPVELFQVDGPEDIEVFPSLRAVPAEGHNLQRPGDTFFGRQQELDELAEAVGPGRLVTVRGTGGIGKTRLATEHGIRNAGVWRDGVWMIDLSRVPVGQPVAGVAADALGAVGDGEPLDDVIRHIRSWRGLLIVDNCEHVLDHARGFVTRVLHDCPEVGVLATSRERLGVKGEQTFPLSALPGSGAGIDLFIDRGLARDPSWSPTPDERDVVLEICRQVDGIALAIELAAARVNVLTAQEILYGLRQRLGTLGSPVRGTEDRQRTLRGLVDWSYALLESNEQEVFRRLAVFAGSFDLATAAAAVGDDIAADDIPDIIWSLVDKSLVEVDRGEGSTRYRLLATLRAVAGAYCDEAEETSAARARLGTHYLGAFPWRSIGHREWRARLDLEHTTITELAPLILVDGDEELALAVGRLGIEKNTGTASGEGLATARRLIGGSRRGSAGLARLHILLAKALAERGDLDGAATHLTEAEKLTAEFGREDRLGRVMISGARTQLCLRVGTVAAVARAEAALRAELAEPLAPTERAISLMELAMVRQDLGDKSTRDLLREATSISADLDDAVAHAFALSNLAEHDLRLGDLADAAVHQAEAMRLSAELGLSVVTAFSFILAARLAQPRGDHEIAVRLHAAADAILEESGVELLPSDRELSDAMLAAARAALGPALAQEVDVGRGLPLPNALAVAEELFAAVQQSAQVHSA